jgi:hypothetical protein
LFDARFRFGSFAAAFPAVGLFGFEPFFGFFGSRFGLFVSGFLYFTSLFFCSVRLFFCGGPRFPRFGEFFFGAPARSVRLFFAPGFFGAPFIARCLFDLSDRAPWSGGSARGGRASPLLIAAWVAVRWSTG